MTGTHGEGISVSESGSTSVSKSGSTGRTPTAGWSTSTTHGWSTQRSTNWSTGWSETAGETRTRVYEFTVEPTQIQALHQTAFILVESGPAGRNVIVADCNP